MRYRVELNAIAKREFNKIELKTADRILRIIESLAENLRPHRCNKLKGRKNQYRIRIGDFRVIDWESR